MKINTLYYKKTLQKKQATGVDSEDTYIHYIYINTHDEFIFGTCTCLTSLTAILLQRRFILRSFPTLELQLQTKCVMRMRKTFALYISLYNMTPQHPLITLRNVHLPSNIVSLGIKFQLHPCSSTFSCCLLVALEHSFFTATKTEMFLFSFRLLIRISFRPKLLVLARTTCPKFPVPSSFNSVIFSLVISTVCMMEGIVTCCSECVDRRVHTHILFSHLFRRLCADLCAI